MRPLAAALLSALALAGVSAARAQTPPPPPFKPVADDSKVAPQLPQGPLAPLSISSDGGVFYIVVETVQRTGDVVSYWTLMVWDPPKQAGGVTLRQAMVRQEIDCAARTHRKRYGAVYDEAGKGMSLGTMGDEPAEPIQPKNAADFQAKAVCDGAMPPPEVFLMGDAAAVADAKRVLAQGR